MKKIICILLIFLYISVFGFSQDNKPIITVLNFNTEGISESEMSSIISLLSSSLFKTEFFTVIDINQRETVLQELKFSMSGCSDDSCMLEVGKLLSAEGIVVGRIDRIGSKYIISAKMLETETGKTMSTADGVYGDLDELIDDISMISAGLAKPYSRVASVEGAPFEASLNLPAIATLSGGIISAGVGAYFLAISMPLLFDYLDAKSAYDGETDASAVAVKYTVYESAWQTAVDGNANTNFIIGASLAGAGIVLTTISLIIFGSTEENSPQTSQISFVPMPEAITVSFQLKY